MKKKYLLLILAAALVCVVCFAACSGKNVTNVEGSLNVIVLDDYSQPIEGASVTLVKSKARAMKTDRNGLVAYDALAVGSYALKIEKQGYASYYAKDVTVECGLADNIAVPATFTFMPVLPKLGASVKGTATITVNGNQQAAAGAEIVLELDNTSLLKRVFTATSDQDGMYMFSDLPENAYFYVYGTVITKEGIEYSTMTIDGYTNRAYSGIKVLSNNVSYTGVSAQFYITTLNSISLNSHTDSIVINFSLPVKTSTLSANNILLDNFSSYFFISVAWSNNNKTLTISPVSGSWGNTNYFQIYFSRSNVYSESGISLGSGTYYLYVYLPVAASAPSEPTGLKLTDDSNLNYSNGSGSVLKIEWNNVSGVSYSVYCRNIYNSSYNYVSNSYQSIVDAKAVCTLSGYFYASDFARGESYEVIVYAYSFGGIQSLNPARLTISPRNPA